MQLQISDFSKKKIQSITIDFYKWRWCSLWLKKTTLLDEEYGRVVYSMLENNDQSIFFFIIFLILLYG